MSVAYEKYPPLPLKELIRDIKLFAGFSSSEKKALITRIVSVYPALRIGCILGGNVFRVRNIGDKPIDKMEDILWPQSVQGANNRFGQMYYVATNQHTALAETEDGCRKIVVMVRYKQERSCFIYPAGEEDTINRGGTGFITEGSVGEKLRDQLKELESKDYDSAMAWALQQAFIAEQCATVERDISQHTFDEIMSKAPDLEGVSYASLKRKEGYNLALSPATFLDNWRIESVTKMRVEPLPYTYYRMTTLATVTAIDSFGHFTWEDNNGHERMETFLKG